MDYPARPQEEADIRPATPSAPVLRRLALVNILLALLVASLTALSLYRSHQDRRERDEIATRNMAMILERHMASVIDKTDLALKAAGLEFERQAAGGGIEAKALNRVLARQQALQPELAGLQIADAAGEVRFGVGETPRRFNVAEHDYFLRARDNPRNELAIGGPVPSRLAGKWTLVFARRLNRPDGSFAGIVYAGIASDHFQSLLAQSDREQAWALELRTGDLRLIARHPWGEGVAAAIGTNAVSPQLRQALQADPGAGTYVATTAMDGSERTLSYARLTDYPLYIVAGLSTADAWNDWRRSAFEELLLAALLVAVALASSALLYRSWMRQRQADSDWADQFRRNRLLAAAEQRRLHRTLLLLNSSNMALLHADAEERLLPEICRLIVEEGGYLMAWVGLAERDKDKTVRPVAQSGYEEGYLESIGISWGETEYGRGPTGTAIRTGKTQINQNVLTHPAMQPWREAAVRRGYQSSIGLPLVIDGIVMGALTIYAAEPDAFSSEEVGLLERLANNLAFGIAGLRARHQLDAAHQELQAFTYAASHDLKAPLRGINSFSGLLEQRYREQLAGDGLRFLGHIQRNATRMTTLIDDLLTYSRLEHETSRIRAVDLPAAVGAILAELEDDIRQCGAIVESTVPAAAVMADDSGLSQVLRNLLGNALKYAAQASPPTIEIGGEQGDGCCRLWVRDNGIGFDMDYSERIFEVFRRLHTYDEYPGSGVGLALVRRAMQRMGGRVWAESAPGEGATFFLELRSAKGTAPPAGPAPAAAANRPLPDDRREHGLA